MFRNLLSENIMAVVGKQLAVQKTYFVLRKR